MTLELNKQINLATFHDIWSKVKVRVPFVPTYFLL